MWAGIVMLGLLGIGATALSLVERRVLRWRQQHAGDV
jgi:ABC-type nitrate/sulfonate/bicarbonate transport system permease component